MTVITTKPILRFLLDRLRANYADSALYTDDDLLSMMNDAYRDACEQSRCLKAIYTFTGFTSGASEAAAPADFSQAIAVYAGGLELERMDLSHALELGGVGAPIGYYVIGQTVGFAPAPNVAGSAVMLYAAIPTPLANLDSTFDPRFPEEFADLIVHYVRWRIQQASGGAERLSQAKYDRDTYDFRVGQLARVSEAVDRIGPQSWDSVAVRYARRSQSLAR